MTAKLLQPPVGLATGNAANGSSTATRHRFEVRCRGCGYGGIVSSPPSRCPMCGGATWVTQGEAR